MEDNKTKCITCNNSYYCNKRGKLLCRKDGNVIYNPEEDTCDDWNKYISTKVSPNDIHTTLTTGHEE